MVRRSRVMRTRSSRGFARRGRACGAAGAAGAGAIEEGEHVALGDAAVLAGAAPTSPATSRCSSISLAAAGSGAWAATSAGGVAGGRPGRARAAAGSRRPADSPRGAPRPGGCSAACAAAELAAGSSTVRAPRRPRPRALRRADRRSTPAAGALHLDRHLVGLQLHQRLVGRTASPACFIQRATVAVVTLSPSVGNLDLGRHVHCGSRVSCGRSAAERCAHQRGFCCGVHLGEAGRRAGRGLAADIGRAPGRARSSAVSTFSIRRSTKFQAPMFSGSSWHHTTSALR